MKRRTLLTLLATLVSWLTIRPKVHADAVKGSYKTPNNTKNVRIRLWDGCYLLNEYDGQHPGEVILGATMPAPSATYLGLGRTVFRRSLTNASTDPDEITYVHYEYESGPMWWTRGARGIPPPLEAVPSLVDGHWVWRYQHVSRVAFK